MRHVSVTLMTLVITAAGCSQPKRDFLAPPEPAVVWPKSPDQPRVRYLGDLTGSEDIGVKKSFRDAWGEFLYGPRPPMTMATPQAVAVDDTGTKVAVADVSEKCVHLFDLQAKTYKRLIEVGASSGQGAAERPKSEQEKPDRNSPAINSFECPVAVCWAGDTLWVADARLHALAIFRPDGSSRWTGGEKLKRPAGIAYCPANQLCYVCDAGAHRVLAFDANGTVVSEFGSHGTGPGQFNVPSHLACGGDVLVIADSLNFRVQRLSLDGSPIVQFGQKGDAAGEMALPKGVAVGPDGAIWVVDAHFENVQAFTPQGELLMSFGQEGHGPGEFWLPAGICIDGQNRMWIADTYNRRVQVFALIQ